MYSCVCMRTHSGPPFSWCHTDMWVPEVDLVVPDRVGQGMPSYAGGVSEVN